MKKWLCLIAVLVTLCIIVSTVAEGERFTIRNGIQFGMTIDEVKKLEGGKPVNDTKQYVTYSPIKISNIEDCALEYHFDDGKLFKIYMSLENDNKKKTQLEKEFKELNLSLISKYGEPLNNKQGTTSQWTTSAFDILSTTLSLAKLTGSKISYDYVEWILEEENGIVKIDHVWYFSKASKGDAIFHALVYQWFGFDTEGI